MLTYRERHKNTLKKSNQSSLHINIDYLILNLEGNPFGHFNDFSEFSLKYFDYGTKIFSQRAELYYKNQKIAFLQHSPRSSILNQNLAQLQFENNLFYTLSRNELKTILTLFLFETGYNFASINRLDICLDKNDLNNTYRSLHKNILDGNYLISGRPKNLQSYFETYKGKSLLNGFQVGKRTSDKIIRIYNKTLSLQLNEKQYINDYYKNNGLKNENVWRFEFQLNSSFFRNLKQYSPANRTVFQDMTWGIFDVNVLIELFKIAQNGYFDIHENTGKSQINKEKKILFFDFDKIVTSIIRQSPIIRKLAKPLISNTVIKKRLAKSLFREYYSNQQNISYILALNLVLEDNDVLTDKPLKIWFKTKIHFYLHEFITKEKIIMQFDKKLFLEHQNLFL